MYLSECIGIFCTLSMERAHCQTLAPCDYLNFRTRVHSKEKSAENVKKRDSDRRRAAQNPRAGASGKGERERLCVRYCIYRNTMSKCH